MSSTNNSSELSKKENNQNLDHISQDQFCSWTCLPDLHGKFKVLLIDGTALLIT